ncbi:hypothetical protein [Magnetospirillum molischianum]|uniref:Uncharacterized protein n=1 Tax=Magnetospirillum molischianum DSM 120 TaxID=1150626 RepID=H8FUW6_MAGML|nr:hypothetical protein [Magnetospirillum molischianum]CCG42154.1 conserved hypothetical protein [Magnetospirillum molischianum DSM 120]
MPPAATSAPPRPVILKHMVSGAAVPLLSPTAADIRWRDIAEALGKLCRFTGAVMVPHYSVAQHCRLVETLIGGAIISNRYADLLIQAARGCIYLQDGPDHAASRIITALDNARRDHTIARRLSLAALIHDAHEAHIGDIATPVAEALAELGVPHAVDQLKGLHDRAIYDAAGLPWPVPEGWRTVINTADKIALATERRDLLATPLTPWVHPLPAPAPWPIKAERGDIAACRWLEQLTDLML